MALMMGAFSAAVFADTSDICCVENCLCSDECHKYPCECAPELPQGQYMYLKDGQKQQGALPVTNEAPLAEGESQLIINIEVKTYNKGIKEWCINETASTFHFAVYINDVQFMSKDNDGLFRIDLNNTDNGTTGIIVLPFEITGEDEVRVVEVGLESALGMSVQELADSEGLVAVTDAFDITIVYDVWYGSWSDNAKERTKGLAGSVSMANSAGVITFFNTYEYYEKPQPPENQNLPCQAGCGAAGNGTIFDDIVPLADLPDVIIPEEDPPL